MGARPVLIAAAGVAYVAASHWLMTRAPASDWNAVVVIGPMLALAGWVAWQRGLRLAAAALGVGTLALVAEAWRGGGLSTASLYVAQHVVIHLLLALAFGMTLLRAREPLIVALARRVHGRLTSGMAVYARKVTAAWALYFVAMAVLSLMLFRYAPFEIWAVFANFATPLAMVAMFIGEHLLRYRLHPEFERATLAQAMRAYSNRHES